MPHMNVMENPQSISERLLEIDFYTKIKAELLFQAENRGVYKELEDALLAEWQLYPNSKEYDYLLGEKINLEQLKMALSFWRSLPSDVVARDLLLENLKKQKNKNHDIDLALQCFEKYHLKNLSLLRKHWYNCFPGEENKPYDPGYFNVSIIDKNGLLSEIVSNLNEASLSVDLIDEADGQKRFKDFLKKIVDAGLFTNSEELCKNYYTFLQKNLHLDWEDWEK
jgi:hypothetical protein